MFNYQTKKDFLVYCIEKSYNNIEFCNDFYSMNKINKELKIIHCRKYFIVYLFEKNRYKTNKTVLYTTKKSNKLLDYTSKLYKLMII